MKKSDIVLVAFFCLWIVFVAGWMLLRDGTVFSEKEKRYLAQAPELVAEEVFDGRYGTAVEDWMSDQFPERDLWVALNAYIQYASGLNGANGVYLGSDGYLLQTPARRNERVQAVAARRIASFAETVDAEVSMLLVPSAGFLLADKLPALHDTYMDDVLIEETRLAVGDEVAWIDAIAPLRAIADQEPYYRTDHHWTTRGAYAVYRAYCAARGLTPIEEDAFTVETSEGFYGTNWSGSGYFGVAPDRLEIWRDPSLSVTVTIPETGVTTDSPFFPDRLSEMDQYPVFLDGNHDRVEITNANAEGETLLVIKDSYAHCFAPFLAAHYQKIILIDLRYYHLPLSTLCETERVTDVLILYSLGTYVDAQDLAWLK